MTVLNEKRIDQFRLASSVAMTRTIQAMILSLALWEEEIIRRMLGMWVSELTPSLVYREPEFTPPGLNAASPVYKLTSRLVGLTAEEYPVGIICPLLVRVEDVSPV